MNRRGAGAGKPIRAWCGLALARQVDALRQRPVTQQILLWELSQSNGLTRKLNELRETRTQQLVRRTIELGGRRVDTRLLAVHSLLGAASDTIAELRFAPRDGFFR